MSDETETHRFSFEGNCAGLFDHLRDEHGAGDQPEHWRTGVTQTAWSSLDRVHELAHAPTLAYTYDWHAEAEGTTWKWLVPTLIGSLGAEEFESLSEATNRFNSTELSIFINGTEVNARHFIESLDVNFDRSVAAKFRELLLELEMGELFEAIDDAQRAARLAIRARLLEAGITWNEENE